MSDIAEIMARAICRHIRRKPCDDCPATVETVYGEGAQMCRLDRDAAAEDILAALSKAGYVVVKCEQPNPEAVARRYAREMSCRIGAAITGE